MPPDLNTHYSMASKKPCSLLQNSAKPAFKLMQAPRSSQDVIMLLQYAASKGLADTKLVAHFSEMSALFPQESLDAYRAFQAKQAGAN
jgi:hypothetical protein